MRFFRDAGFLLFERWGPEFGLDECSGYGTSGLRDCTVVRVGMKGFSNRIEDPLNRPALLLNLTMLFARLLASLSVKSCSVKICRVYF